MFELRALTTGERLHPGPSKADDEVANVLPPGPGFSGRIISATVVIVVSATVAAASTAGRRGVRLLPALIPATVTFITWPVTTIASWRIAPTTLVPSQTASVSGLITGLLTASMEWVRFNIDTGAAQTAIPSTWQNKEGADVLFKTASGELVRGPEQESSKEYRRSRTMEQCDWTLGTST